MIRKGLKSSSTVENAADFDTVYSHLEENSCSAFETDDAQPGANIVTPSSSLGEFGESIARGLDTLDVSSRDRAA